MRIGYAIGATVESTDRVENMQGRIVSMRTADAKTFRVQWSNGSISVEHRGTCVVVACKEIQA